jgi:CRP-like cAMP-binding protein
LNLSKDKVEALRRRVSLFYGFEDEHITSLLNFARRRELRDGELIISEGTLSTKVFILISGGANVSRRIDSTEEHIATLPVGATVGEMGIIDSAPRSARVVAKGPTTILEIDMDGFHTLPAEALSMIYRNLSKVLVKRVRGANSRIKVLAESLLEHIDLSALILKDGLVGAELDGLRASGVSVENGEFRAGIFSDCDFTGADFSNSVFSGADFEEANLNGASMESVTMQHVIFKGADLSGADFRGANLTGAIFDSPSEGNSELRAIGEDEDDDGSLNDSMSGMMKAPGTEQE